MKTNSNTAPVAQIPPEKLKRLSQTLAASIQNRCQSPVVDAEDVQQEILLAIHDRKDRMWRSYDPGKGDLIGYLYTAMYRRLLPSAGTITVPFARDGADVPEEVAAGKRASAVTISLHVPIQGQTSDHTGNDCLRIDQIPHEITPETLALAEEGEKEIAPLLALFDKCPTLLALFANVPSSALEGNPPPRERELRVRNEIRYLRGQGFPFDEKAEAALAVRARLWQVRKPPRT